MNRQRVHQHSIAPFHPQQLSNHLRELVVRALLNIILDSQQNCRLPLVELAHLVVRVQLVGELLLVTLLYSLDQVSQELVLSLPGKRWVHLAVSLQRSLRGNQILVCEVADACLEEVLLDRVAHQVVVE